MCESGVCESGEMIRKSKLADSVCAECLKKETCAWISSTLG